MQNATTIDSNEIQQWITAQLEPKAVEEALIARGFDKNAVAIHLKEYRRLNNAKRLFAGFVCLGIGAFLGFISCVLTLLNNDPAMHSFILYGLTSLGIMVIVAGLYLILE